MTCNVCEMTLRRAFEIADEQARLIAIRAKRDLAGCGYFGIAVSDDLEAKRWRELNTEREAMLAAACRHEGMVKRPTREALLAAIERGWTHPINSHKEMDSDLVESINMEVRGLLEGWETLTAAKETVK